IVPVVALEHARREPPSRTDSVTTYLEDTSEPWGLDLNLEIRINGDLVSQPDFGDMYWTCAQQLAHMTANGAALRVGDLFASGTVSSEEGVGSLIELTRNGEKPLVLADGSRRTFLEDGDEVVMSATAPGSAATTIGFGEVAGRVLAAT
ncbi:MAG: fumarylacetoacetate hydrolase family protein, partial [Actinomycetota bacterium]